MIPILGDNFRLPTPARAVLFGLLFLCATVDLLRNWSIAGITFLGGAVLASCGVAWAVFLIKPVLPHHVLKSILFLVFFELYCIGTMFLNNTGMDGVQLLVVGLVFLALILISARETSENLSNGVALHQAILVLAAFPVALFVIVVIKLQKLGDTEDAVLGARPFALYAMAVVAVALARWRSNAVTKSQSRWALIWAITVTAAVALSLSRTALVCLLVQFPLAILLRLDKKSIVVSLLVLLGGGALFAAAVMSYQPLYDRFFANDAAIKVGGVAINASGRTKIWELLLESMGNNWMFGSGLGSSQILVRHTFTNVGQPHNDYLRYYFDTGAFGLTLWFCFMWTFISQTFSNLRRSLRNDTPDYPMHVAALLAFTSVCWSMLTDNTVCYNFVMMPQAIIMGCSLGAGAAVRRPRYFSELSQIDSSYAGTSHGLGMT